MLYSDKLSCVELTDQPTQVEYRQFEKIAVQLFNNRKELMFYFPDMPKDTPASLYRVALEYEGNTLTSKELVFSDPISSQDITFTNQQQINISSLFHRFKAPDFEPGEQTLKVSVKAGNLNIYRQEFKLFLMNPKVHHIKVAFPTVGNDEQVFLSLGDPLPAVSISFFDEMQKSVTFNGRLSVKFESDQLKFSLSNQRNNDSTVEVENKSSFTMKNNTWIVTPNSKTLFSGNNINSNRFVKLKCIVSERVSNNTWNVLSEVEFQVLVKPGQAHQLKLCHPTTPIAVSHGDRIEELRFHVLDEWGFRTLLPLTAANEKKIHFHFLRGPLRFLDETTSCSLQGQQQEMIIFKDILCHYTGKLVKGGKVDQQEVSLVLTGKSKDLTDFESSTFSLVILPKIVPSELQVIPLHSLFCSNKLTVHGD
jgi:hypothetical protein